MTSLFAFITSPAAAPLWMLILFVVMNFAAFVAAIFATKER